MKAEAHFCKMAVVKWGFTMLEVFLMSGTRHGLRRWTLPNAIQNGQGGHLDVLEPLIFNAHHLDALRPDAEL